MKKGTLLKNRYQILEEKGHGGFGTVYSAIDQLLGRFVAIKSSSNSLAKEAKLLKELKNVPRISHIYDYFHENGNDYIVMRLLDGKSLAQYYREKGTTLTISEVRPLLTSLCVTLSQMHKCGIIHRDISPGNILITEDNVPYLIDYGTATSITNHNLRNILDFSHKGLDAPERKNENQLGPGTDIYSLCATIVFLLSGEGIPDYADRIKYDPLPALLPRLSINSRQQNALLKGLNIDIAKRYNDATTFLQDFENNDTIYGESDVKYHINYFAKTDIGKRKINQDNFMIDSFFSYASEDCEISGTFPSSSSHLHIAAIADGVSSSCYGELASKAAIQAISHFIDSYRYSEALPERLLENLLDQLNEKIITLGNKIGHTSSTVTILTWINNHYYIANIGDSPIYLFRNGRLTQLSTPHTKANEMTDNPSEITPSDYHTLTRFLGKKHSAGSQMASYVEGTLNEGDTFFICSDGVTNVSNNEIIRKALKKGGSKALATLWKYAKKSPKQDNCTAIILNFR